MARNKKVEILSNDKEVLHPMTDGDCVIFEDGQTLAQKLSEDDSVKYTPEIVNSSPMFKVGEGNTVDYSDNVLDGAYERATLQGQTYVNYIQESSADEVTLPTPFTEYERTQHNTLTSNEEGTLGINLVGQSYVNALQHDSEEEYVVLGESLEFQEKKVEYTNEGQIKSAMLKGQTLVNIFKSFANYTYSASEIGAKWLITGSASLTETVNNDELTMTLTGVGSKVVRIDDVSMLKPNTKYMVKVNYTTSFGWEIYFGWLDNSIFYTQIATMKSNEYAIFTTPSDLSTWRGLWFGILGDLQIGDTIKISKPVLFEYQEGMENWDIPYFEGMQSVTVSTRLENKLGTFSGTVSTSKTGKTFTTTDGMSRSLYLYGTETASTNPINLKPNTKYLIQFAISNLVLDGLAGMNLIWSDSTLDSGNCLFGENTGVKISANGTYRTILTTTDLIATSSFVVKGYRGDWEGSGSSLRSLTISNIMCVEYQNGMENWDLPYFEDYQVMKPVQVESASKNLIDINNVVKSALCSYTISSNGVTITQTQDAVNGCFVAFPHYLEKGKTYTFSATFDNPQGNNIYIRVAHTDGNNFGQYVSGGTTDVNGSSTKTFTCENSGIHYMHIYNKVYDAAINVGSVVTWTNIQLEESSTATEYVPHQSKTTYSWDEVILRKVGDVEDTLDLTTGEWVQRIGEVVLDGNSENWVVGSYTEIPFHIQGELPNNCIDEINSTKILSSYNKQIFQNNSYGSVSATSYYRIRGIVFCPPEGITTREQAIEYIQSNPITIQYVLETPIVHKVNLSRPNLQVYDDITHVHTKCLDGTLIPNIYLPSDISYPAILEPSTTYNVCINQTEVSADNPLKVNVGGTEITMTDSRMTLTTPATLANSNVSFTGKGNKIKESMLIKNSSLLTRDLPHFNGIGSVQLGKTIENLCGSNCYGVGTATFTEVPYNDKIVVTVTKQGSLVYVFELTRQLENGKQYYVYMPNTYPTNYQGIVGFRKMYNGTLTFAAGAPSDGVQKSSIIEINQTDNPYTHLTFGRHGGDLPVNTVIELQRPIICEYEPGMENWDWESIGYFTGTKNIGNEFMRVQNKNLVDTSKIVQGVTYNDGRYDKNPDTMGDIRCTLLIKDAIKIKPETTYTVSASSDLRIGYYLLDENKNIFYDSGWVESITFTTPSNAFYLIYNIRRNDNTSIKASDITSTSIQLEKSSTATTYTAHKHNGLYITKDQPINLTWEQGRINPSGVGDSYTNAINNAVSYGVRNKGLLNLKPNTTYRISLGDKTNFKYHIAVFDDWDNALSAAASLSLSGDWVSSKDTIFTTTKDAHKIGINVQKQDASSITPSEINHVRLEEVTDVVLRSIGNVHDELDITRGIYTQRIGEVVFDGDELWNYTGGLFGVGLEVSANIGGNFEVSDSSVAKFINNRYNMYNVYTDGDNGKGITLHAYKGFGGYVFIRDGDFNNVNDFKTYLQKNPIIIHYVLASPIIHQINILSKNETNTEVTKPNDVFTLPTLYTEQTHIDLTNNGIMPKVQSRDYIAYPVLPMIGRTYTLQHNLTGGVSNLTIDLLGRTQSVSYQNHKSLVYSPETMDAVLHNELRISGKGKISGVMYIDGGYMDRDIPYIEGMKNAVNPIVRNVGKNLYNNKNCYIFNDGKYIGTKDWNTKPTFKMKPNTNYTITFETASNDTRIVGWKDGKFISNLGGNASGSSRVTINTGICNGLSFYRQVVSGVTLDYRVTISETVTEEPYKENICYVDCGEIKLTPDMFEQGNIVYNNVNAGATYESMKQESHIRIRTKELIKIKPNTKYLLNFKGGYRVFVREFDVNKGKLNDSALSLIDFQSRGVFTTNANAQYISLLIGNLSDTSLPLSDFDKFNLLLIENDDMVILRSLPHGVQDEIDLETGKYIQRVGEITFNGTENWSVGYPSWDNKLTYYNYDFIDIKLMKGDNGSGQAYYDALRCPQLHRSYMGKLASASIDGICSYYYSGYQRIFISKQDCATVNELKLWLKENPITVQYELPEPIVKDIVIHNYPHSYEGGHVIIENGDPNTPIPAQLTYRAATNRSGQIQQHTEQVEKQEREINELETLILANIHLSQTR